jgi:hypothetical protein
LEDGLLVDLFVPENDLYPIQGHHPIFAKAHKGFNRSQSDIAGSGAVTPLGFQMVKERQHERGINLFEL